VDKDLYLKIANSTAHRQSRESNASLILNNRQLLPELLQIAYRIEDKNHHKASWSLELIFENDIDLLGPHLDGFCQHLPKWKTDGAVRAAAKICMMAARQHVKSLETGKDFLAASHITAISESCFDWLIGEAKVAPKAYGIRALFALGKSEPWIYPDLKTILSEDFFKYSAAYQAAAREILKKIG
jgi:hypothetical protein